jgi:hypothetical protein
MTQAPFTAFEGWLKQVEEPEYEIDRRVVETAFPGFFGEPGVDYEGREFLEESFKALGTSLDGWEPAYRYRRYAGGSNLPRGRYYTVCVDKSGNDRQTLAREFQAYIDADQSGEVYVYDMTDPGQLAARQWFSQFRNSPISSDEIVVSFRSKPGMASPMLKVMTEANDIEVPELPMFLRSCTHQESFDRVIDLRRPATQQWVFEQLTFGIPHTLFGYENGYRTDIVVRRTGDLLTKRGPLERVSTTIEASRECKTAIFYPPLNTHDSRHVVADVPNNFFGVMSYLLFPFRGGSPVTEVIGRWLRGLGAEALVFPSARNDVTVHIERGELLSSSGWNLVDFRDSPAPDDCIRHVKDTEGWRFLPPMSRLRTAPESSDYHGSFTLEGLASQQDRYLQAKYEDYYSTKRTDGG